MLRTALFVRLEAKPGREGDVETFLRGARRLVEDEPETTAWFALRMGPTVFGIFDAFPDESGRQSHLLGKVAEALMRRAPEFFSRPPQIEKLEVLAEKIPGQSPERHPHLSDLPPESYAP